MGSHPINLAIRFLLELIMLATIGFWGWKQSDGWLQFVLVIGLPILAAAIWGTFAVPNDPSRSGGAPIVVPGIIRLSIEIMLFAFAVWALRDLEFPGLSLILGILVAIHYIISYDRIIWLINH